VPLTPVVLTYLCRIVAVHGLGAHPEFTWTCEAPASSAGRTDKRRVHLLNDLLKAGYPEARILTFSHNSDWLINAPIKTSQQIGRAMVQQLKEHRLKYHVRTSNGFEILY
jgi:hypothetical protein